MSQDAAGPVWLTWALALGAGIVVGAWTDDSSGFAIGLALGYLLAERLRLSARVEALHRRILELEIRVRAAAHPPAREPAVVTPSTSPRAAPPRVEVTKAAAETETPASEPVIAPATWGAPPELPAAPIEPGVFDRALGEALAWLKRGNPVARAGIVILFFGAAFLAKYAAEHSMLPIELRLAAIAAGAAALLVVGWRLRETRAIYAQILQGGGIAGLYLTVFAAARLYHLLPQGFALPLLVAVAIASALLAVAQGALALAVIGFAGGFLAPVLLSTGGGNHVALFSYYAVLNLGVFTVAWFRAWRVLNLVGFVFTFTITGAWRAFSYAPGNLVSADFFLLLFFVMYVGISILFALRQRPDLRGYVSGSLVFGLPVVVFTLQATLLAKTDYGLAFSALGFAVFYLALAWTLFLSRHPHLGLLAEAFTALGVVFASLAVPLAFDHQTTAAMWAVEGAGLLWIGVRQDRKLARAFGALLQLAGGIGFLMGLSRFAAGTPVLNTAFIGTLLLAVSGALSARWLHRHAAALAPYEKRADTAALLWATAWWLYGGVAEIGRSVSSEFDYGAGIAWCGATLLLLTALRRAWSWALPGLVAAALLPAMTAISLYAAVHGHPLAEGGFAGWPLLIGAGYALLYALDRFPDESAASLMPWLHAGSYAALAVLGAWETGWQVERSVPGVWSSLPWALAPALLLWLANRPRPAPAWPLQAHRDAYQRHAGAPLAIWAALWLLVVNLSNPGDPAWIPYLPLLNPLDVTSALTLLALAGYVAALTPAQRKALWPWGLREFVALAAALVFVWLNAALVRALHHGFDTPLTLHGLRHSVMVQASLSVFWTLLGLSAMMLATRRHWRPVWIAGAGMMAVVVLKLFLIDLAGTGTIARIASFLSVGLLMLVAGYLSPLPPGDARKESP